MINYQDQYTKGRVQMILHKHVVPHIFICNDYGHLPKNERIELLQQLHQFNERNIGADKEQVSQDLGNNYNFLLNLLVLMQIISISRFQ